MKDAAGATAIEYALIGAVVSIIIATAATSMGSSLVTFFNSVVAGFNR